MKHQRLALAGITSLAVVLVLGIVGCGDMSQVGQAEELPEPTAILEYPDIPPTATVAPVPTDDPAAVAGTVLFEDTFATEASLADWTFLDLEERRPGTESVWVIEDEQLVQDRTANAGNPNIQNTLAVTGGSSWTDYTITAKVYDQANATFGLVARRNGNSFYRYRLIASEYEAEPKQVIEKVIDGDATTLTEIDAPGYAQRQWHTVSMTVQGPTITVSFNDEVMAEATDETLTSGQAGFYTVAIGDIFFDDVTITVPYEQESDIKSGFTYISTGGFCAAERLDSRLRGNDLLHVSM